MLESPLVKKAARPARAPKSVKVGMIGLGCAKNLVDGEVMLGHLTEHGAEIVTDIDSAEVVIVNTCGFVEDAKRESIDAILEVAGRKGDGTLRRLVVAGCMAQRYARELAAEVPEIDAFVGLDELERAPEAALGRLGRHLPDQRGALKLYDHTAPRLLATGGVFTYLKVAEGCDNPCTFCHIPAMRGAFRSRPLASLVAEARRLEEAGVRELVLIAQDTTRYGEDLGMGRTGLRRLLEALLAGTSLPWLRFMYAYPATLDPGIFPLMARESRLAPYLDIPLQHAARPVLKLMKRGGDARRYRELIAKAREKVPGLAVRTTFIVGFPGEGEAEFAELQAFVDEIRFDHVGVFAYSFQEENPGAALGDPVPPRTKERRRRDAHEAAGAHQPRPQPRVQGAGADGDRGGRQQRVAVPPGRAAAAPGSGGGRPASVLGRHRPGRRHRPRPDHERLRVRPRRRDPGGAASGPGAPPPVAALAAARAGGGAVNRWTSSATRRRPPTSRTGGS